MKRQQFFRHRLQTLAALREAVGAMRSLSAHHFRLMRLALPAARAYRDEVNSVIEEIGIHQQPSGGGPAGMLVLGSDLGLCGNYNSLLAKLAVSEAKRLGVERIYSVGRRVRRMLLGYSLPSTRFYETPASQESISTVLLSLAQDLFEDYLASNIGSLYVVSAGFEGVGHFKPLSVRVLPIDPVASTCPVRRSPYVDSSHLTLVAAREFLYITLYELLLDSLAAEHGMRLMATESALEWLESTTESTSRKFAAVRSELSTQELLDIVAGSRVKMRNATS